MSTHWKDWCWSFNTLATWCEEQTSWKRFWCRERLKAEGEEDDRGWDGWMASLIQWTWTWANSRKQWRTGRPSILQSMGSQRVRHDGNWTTIIWLATVWMRMNLVTDLLIYRENKMIISNEIGDILFIFYFFLMFYFIYLFF